MSRTDKGSGHMVRDGKSNGFFYLDHRTVDGRHAIITDTHVTPANVHDSVPYLGPLDRQRERFNFSIRAVGVDAGYAAATIISGLEEREIYRSDPLSHTDPSRRLFVQARAPLRREARCLHLPQRTTAPYRTTNREGYRQYHSDPQQCRNCPVRHKCTQSSNATKVVTRHVWEASRERTDQHRLSRVGKRIYKRRKETVERSFADGKQPHGHRNARMRGLARVQQQCLLAATAQNIKKIALMMSQNGPKYAPSEPPGDLKRKHNATEALPVHRQSPRLERLKNQSKNKPHQNDGVRQQSEYGLKPIPFKTKPL